MVMVPPSLMSASPETTTYWLVSLANVIVASNHGPGSAGRLEGDGRGADGMTGGVGFERSRRCLPCLSRSGRTRARSGR